MTTDQEKGISLRIPRRLILAENEETIMVRFPDANQFLMAVMSAMTNDDPKKVVALDVSE